MQHNGITSLPMKVPRDRLGNLKWEATVKLEEGANSIQVRMLFGDLHKRLSPKDWTAWSEELDPAPIGPGPINIRQDRLSEYLNPSNVAAGARAEEQQSQNAHLSTQLQGVMAAHSQTSRSVKGSGVSQTPRVSVAAVMQANEKKTVLKKEVKGPPAEVKQRFGTTRQAPFVLTPCLSEATSAKDGVVSLNLGENFLFHDPEDTGPDALFCTVHAYLKRLLISTTCQDTVVLISAEEGEVNARGPLGFQTQDDNSVRTTLLPSQQYSASVGDRIEFLDSGMMYSVGRQVVQRMPGRVRIQSPGEQQASVFEDRRNGIELHMTIAADFQVYVPQSAVQKAQFQQLFLEDIASSLGIDVRSVEFISCHPVTVTSMASGNQRGMTEVIFLILPGDPASGTFRNQHLGPRVLAAELAALVADANSDLHRCITLRDAYGLKFKVGLRQAPKGASKLQSYDAADGSSTASTLSEPDPLSDQAISDSDGLDEKDVEVASKRGPASKVQIRKRPPGDPHPLRTVEGRLATFGGWSMGNKIKSGHGTRPESLALSPLALATAGFYRIDDPDSFHTVRCAYCRIELQDLLQYHTHPSAVHANSSPNCPMVFACARIVHL